MAEQRPREQRERRTRGLLSSYYGVGANAGDPLDLDGPNFNSDKYVHGLLEGQGLNDLVCKGNDLVTEIKSLDSDMQMLVYENYNKFISATDTIRAMKHKVEGMEDEMNQLATNMDRIIESNHKIADNVTGRRGRLDKLNSVRKLLLKLQFLFDLPRKLQACVDDGEHEKAVRYFQAAAKILKHHGHLSSFQPIHDEAVEIVGRLKRKLEGSVADDALSLGKLSECVRLLMQLQGNHEELLERFAARSRELIRTAVTGAAAGSPAAEGAEEWAPGEAPEAEAGATAQCARLGETYVEATLAFASEFAALFVRGLEEPARPGAASSGAASASAAYARERKLALLEQCVRDTFDKYAALATATVAADREGDRCSVEASTGLIQTLTKSAAVVVEECAASGVPLPKLRAHASTFCAKLAREAVAEEARGLEEGLAAALTGLRTAARTASVAVSHRTVAPKFQDLVGTAAGAVLEAVDKAIQSVRPLLLALPGQGLVKDLVSRLVGALRGLLEAICACEPAAEAKAAAAAGATPTATLAMTFCAFSSELAGRFKGELPRIVTGHLMFARAEWAGPLPVDSLVADLQAAASSLNVRSVDLLAREMVGELRAAFAAADWVRMPQPRAVSPHAVAVIEHIPRVEALFAELLGDPSGGPAPPPPAALASLGAAATAKPDWLPGGPFPPPKHYSSRLKQQQMSASVIQSDIDRMFAQKSTMAARAVESTRGANGRVLELVLKAMYELVRCCTLSQGGYQQLEVDTSMLRWAIRECVEDKGAVQALLDEVMTSAHERCLHPEPLEAELIEAMCEAKRQQLEKSWVKGTPVPT